MYCIVSDLVLEFEASPTPHLKHYKLYYEKAPNPVTYNSESVVLGKETRIILNELDKVKDLEEGTYNLGVVAVNEVDYESCMSKYNNFVIVFDPPVGPGDLLFMRKARLL